ncbi:50S ribosomal protein L4 [Candidatus Pacearchaeota archaeon]|nr:50S ribosomal protein L4 [Candidatus Pacearchaeota archaeon]
MKANILSIEGEKIKEITLPEYFSEKIREDIISKVLEAKKIRQPYAPMFEAGMQYSASGKIRHRRHVWKGHYGKGVSRVPRKIMSKRGSNFVWEGATIPGARGGRRAHPPKILSIIKRKKLNKREMKMALSSALSATANEKEIRKKYSSLNNFKGKDLPFIVESKMASLKTKDLFISLKKILGEDLFGVALKKKNVRSGKGKMRGRKYKASAGLLIVIGKNEKMKANAFDSSNTENLSVIDLAEGGQGRLTIYTEQAINELNKKLGEK